MTLLQGVDRAGAIALWEAQALKSRFNIQWCGVYIGGPTNGGYGWTQSVVEDLATIGWKFMPIYVGQNTDWTPVERLNQAQGVIDGNQAAALMQSFGWKPNKGLVVALDVEYNTNEQHLSKAVEYMVSWCNTVTKAGYLPAIYSHAFALNAYAKVAQVPTYAWTTAWITGGKMDTNVNVRYGLTGNFADNAIQYTGGTWLDGQVSNFDLDAATSSYPLCPAPSAVGAVKDEAVTIHFDETNHSIGGGFLRFWQKYGGIRIFGYPITDEFQENGKTVQYFERARFERNPNNGDADNWNVELGLLGSEARKA